jgi:hypothetical protein
LIASTITTLTRRLKRCLSGFPMEYVEVYEPRAGFVHLHDGYDTLGPLGEIASKAAQHVTRSRGWNTTI